MFAAMSGPSVSTARVQSIDLIRGAVMVLMAIDHVRVYSGLPAGGPTAGVFFTRWVTHFCAPAFVFLAGTGAFLAARKPALADLSGSFLRAGAWAVPPLRHRTLFALAVDGRDAARLGVRRDHTSPAVRARPPLPANRVVGDRRLPRRRRARGLSEPRSSRRAAGAVSAPEPEQIPGIAAVSADDA